MDVSVIIPVYNVQNYIQKCLASVVTQTYQGSIECILVDDCGTDQSVSIAEQFIAGISTSVLFRIVHHQKNQGLSAARNTGIKEAKGHWLFFLDSDDWIASRCIEIMMQKVTNTPDLEMVMGNYNYVGKQLDLIFAQNGIYSDGLINMSHVGLIYPMAHNKLISKSFIVDNDLFFEEGLLHEDVLWTLQVSCYLKKFESIADKTYNYVIHTGSISTQKSYDFHYRHFANVKLKSIEFAFSRGFQINIDLYKSCTDELYWYIFEPIKLKKEALAKSFYDKYRNTPFWSVLFVFSHRRGWAEFCLSLNRLLPRKLGYCYLKILYLFQDKSKIQISGLA